MWDCHGHQCSDAERKPSSAQDCWSWRHLSTGWGREGGHTDHANQAEGLVLHQTLDVQVREEAVTPSEWGRWQQHCG